MSTTTTAPAPATYRQVGYATDLGLELAERAAGNEERTTVLDAFRASYVTVKIDKKSMSQWISLALKTLGEWKVADRAKPQSQATPISWGVAEGYYALEIDGETKFYKIDCPTEGRWAGRTFVNVQASDNFYPLRGRSGEEVLRLIRADPEAGPRYGRTIGKCYLCHRTLTSEWRKKGVGPVCVGKV